MKNIQVIDDGRNCVYDIFAATEEEFALIFPHDQDVAFINEVIAREEQAELDTAFTKIWKRRVPKAHANGIHGILFLGHEEKKQYYPTRKDEEAANSDGSLLRLSEAERQSGLEKMKAAMKELLEASNTLREYQGLPQLSALPTKFCAFCGGSKEDVGPLVHAERGSAFICRECAVQASRALMRDQS